MRVYRHSATWVHMGISWTKPVPLPEQAQESIATELLYLNKRSRRTRASTP